MFCETVRNHDKIISIKVKYELISQMKENLYGEYARNMVSTFGYSN